MERDKLFIDIRVPRWIHVKLKQIDYSPTKALNKLIRYYEINKRKKGGGL